ncbi:MAG: hypothetical protein VCA34_05675, partial [Roseibacillus sp.]
MGIVSGQTPLEGCDQHPGNPELISGAASCVYNEVNGVGQTTITLDDTSIIHWDHLGLSDPASTLIFEWSGGATNAAVVNRLEQVPLGQRQQTIAGTIEFQDGALIVNSPNAALNITGNVAAHSLIITTHNLDLANEQQLLSGQSADFTGSAHPLTVIDGHIVTTDGDLVLAGAQVLNSAGQNPADGPAQILAQNGSVRIFGGQNFRLLPSGNERIQRLPGDEGGGFLLNSKTIRAAQHLEIVAESEIVNNGRLEAGPVTGQAYLRVDTGGTILNHSNAIIEAGVINTSVQIEGMGQIIKPDEGDSPSPLSTGISRFPLVNRPGEVQSSRRVVVYENAPTTGSASSQRQRSNRSVGASPRRN